MKLPKLFDLKRLSGVGDGEGGFTMIELLVVISVIGVLAVAVLSSINPIEQINKGRDTRTRSDGAQLINAVDRFFAIHEIYPWNDASYATSLAPNDTLPNTAFPDGTVCTATGAPDPAGFCNVTTSVAPDDWLFALSDSAEVKDSYVNRLVQSSNPLYVYKAAVANATMYVCFLPTSKAFEQEATKGCQEKGDLPAGACPQGAPGNPAYPDTYLGEMVCLP